MIAQLAAMSQPHAFGGLHELHIYLLRSQAVGERLGDALAAGAFAALQTLKLRGVTDTGLEALVGKLATSPCSRTLQEMELTGELEYGAGLKALGLALGAGKFPGLVRLGLEYNDIGQYAVEQFVSALGATGASSAASLEEINLRGNPLGDDGVAALAAGFKAGCFGS